MKSANFFPFLEYGSRLRKLRKAALVNKAGQEKPRTQSETAAIVGVNERTYKDWERGVSLPDTSSLLRLSDLFGVSVDYLLCRTESKTINGDNISSMTGFTPAAVDRICEEYQIFKQNISSWQDNNGSSPFYRESYFFASSVVLSDLMENAPDRFSEFINAIHKFIKTEAAPPGPAADDMEIWEHENTKNAEMYRASVEMANMLAAMAEQIRRQLKDIS